MHLTLQQNQIDLLHVLSELIKSLNMVAQDVRIDRFARIINDPDTNRNFSLLSYVMIDYLSNRMKKPSAIEAARSLGAFALYTPASTRTK